MSFETGVAMANIQTTKVNSYTKPLWMWPE